MSYEVGTSYRSTCAISDADGSPVDPVTVTLTVAVPDGTAVSPVVVKDSMGEYHADYTLALEGLYCFQWVTASPVTVKTDYVNASVFRSIIGLAEAKSFVDDEGMSADKAGMLRQVMAAATELAEEVAGSIIQRRHVNERVVGTTRQVIRLPHAPLPSETAVESVTSVYSGGPSWVAADLIVYPDSATVETNSRIPFYFGPWKVTYTAGRAVVPERYRLAVQEIVFDLWGIHRSYGDDDLSPGPEDTARMEQIIASYEISPHAMSLLSRGAPPGFA